MLTCKFLSIWTYAVKYNMAVPTHLKSKTMNVVLKNPIYMFIIILLYIYLYSHILLMDTVDTFEKTTF